MKYDPKLPRTCVICKKEFIGYHNSMYCCDECKAAGRREIGRRFRQRAKERQVVEETQEVEQPTPGQTFRPSTKQCRGCWHWMRMSGFAVNGCHHLLHTGKRRVRDGDRCLSYTPIKGKQETKTVWRDYPSGASPLSGYEMTK